jgi:hypothetical protein
MVVSFSLGLRQDGSDPASIRDLQIADSSFANAVSFFIHAYNETLSVVAMRARDEDCSLLGIDS